MNLEHNNFLKPAELRVIEIINKLLKNEQPGIMVNVKDVFDEHISTHGSAFGFGLISTREIIPALDSLTLKNILYVQHLTHGERWGERWYAPSSSRSKYCARRLKNNKEGWI